MRRSGPVLLLLLLLAPHLALAGGDRPAAAARARVEHHLREVERLAAHFEGVLAAPCPRFATGGEWTAYLDGEVERVVGLLAHLEEAWREAKMTGDDDVRRAAKAPRRRRGEIPSLVQKLGGCADGHGARLEPEAVWLRIQDAVPRRRAEIALPE